MEKHGKIKQLRIDEDLYVFLTRLKEALLELHIIKLAESEILNVILEEEFYVPSQSDLEFQDYLEKKLKPVLLIDLQTSPPPPL